MRKIISVLLLLAPTTLLSLAQAQQGDKSTRTTLITSKPLRQSDVYQLGTRSVTIPPPVGFSEAFSQSDLLAAILIATEDPNNEVLTAHLPDDILGKLKKGERQEFNFYTKVSVLKLSKARDITQSQFDSVVAYVESTGAQLLDVDGPLMKSAVKNLREGLSSVSGKEVPLEFDQPLNLGSFVKTKDVYSMMLVMSLRAPSDKLPILCGATFVKVNRRLLYVYTYRRFTSEKDAELLRDFTRDWVRQILSANR
jgi:hypothetical protein